MAPLHSSQTPIMDLPIDIIREIFLQCASQFPCHIPPKLADPRVVLTHVCSAWREAALATPELWADILIRVNEWPWSNNVYAAGKSAFSRSSSCPLSLRITQISHIPSISNNDLISQNLPRCRRLNVGLSETAIQEFLLLPPGTLLNLEDIEIYGTGRPEIVGDFINHQDITMFQACPKLRRVTFSSHTKDTNLRRLNLPWRQLSFLALGRHAISPIFCLDILRECTSLSDCAFIIAPADDLIVEDLIILSERPIYLPALHTLRLTFQNLDHHSTFLNTLHLPNLDLFRLTGQWVDSFKWSPSTLKSFDRLDKLDLRTIQGITGDELYNYLSPLRGLTVLQLPLMGIPLVPSSTAFQGLASGTLGPRVTRIAFGLMTFESLITMVGGRLSVSLATGGEVSAFTAVVVHCPAPIDPGGTARVAALSAAGVEISFLMGFME